MDSNLNDGRGFILEGNFTQYLIGLPESGYDFNSTMTIDLKSVPREHIHSFTGPLMTSEICQNLRNK